MLVLKDRIKEIITESKDKVFLRKEFGGMGSYRQVSRALQELVGDGLLIKSGYGIYVKARKSSITGNPIADVSIEQVGFTVMSKLGVSADIGCSARSYRDGLTTQIPMAIVLDIGKSRIKRKITVGKKEVQYEKS